MLLQVLDLSPPPENPRRMINYIPPHTYFEQPVIDLESKSSDLSGSLDINENAFGMAAENTIVFPPTMPTTQASPLQSSQVNATANDPQLSTNDEDTTMPADDIPHPPDMNNIVTTQATADPIVENADNDNPPFFQITILPTSELTDQNEIHPNDNSPAPSATAVVIPMSQVTAPTTYTVVDTASQRSLPTLPMFTRGPGADAVVSILAMARFKGYENTLVHGKRIS